MAQSDILDLSVIENLRALSPDDNDEFFREIAGIFFEDTPQRLAELDQCLAAGDAARFSRTAHSIKGSSANLGAIKVSGIAEQLEHRSRKDGLAGLAPLLPSLRAEYELAKAELGKLLSP